MLRSKRFQRSLEKYEKSTKRTSGQIYAFTKKWLKKPPPASSENLIKFLSVRASSDLMKHAIKDENLHEFIHLLLPWRERLSPENAARIIDLFISNQIVYFGTYHRETLAGVFHRDNLTDIPEEWFDHSDTYRGLINRVDFSFEETWELLLKAQQKLKDETNNLTDLTVSVMDKFPEEIPADKVMLLHEHCTRRFSERLLGMRVFPIEEMRLIPVKVINQWLEKPYQTGSGPIASINYSSADALVQKLIQEAGVEFWDAFKDSWEGTLGQLEETFQETK